METIIINETPLEPIVLEITSTELSNMISGKKPRSEKQKLNDIKLKERLQEQHKKKKELKALADLVNDIVIEQEEEIQEIQDLIAIKDIDYNFLGEEISNQEFIKVTKKSRGRPKKQEKELLPGSPVDVLETISI